jgi:protein translocase SecG subunit
MPCPESSLLLPYNHLLMSPITLIQTILGVLMMVTILLQARGTGLGSTMGGDGSTYATRRGAEQVIFYSSIVLAVLFFGISVARLLL